MYKPVILCTAWNFSFFAFLSTEHGLEYGSSSYPRKRLVYRMNSCCPWKALSQVVMSTHWVDPEDIRQLDLRWKNFSRLPLPFFKFMISDLGISIVLDVGRELVRSSFQQLGLALLLSVSPFCFPMLWKSCSACFLGFLISQGKYAFVSILK